MLNTTINAVILTAGKGSRMHSDIPKVLHKLAGKPMIQHIIDTLKKFGINKIYLVHSHNNNLLRKTLQTSNLIWISQKKQMGTGHSVQQALPFIDDEEDVLVLYGDVPLISVETLSNLYSVKPHRGISLLTTKLDDPSGYGRVIRRNDKITGIIEHKDATDEQRKIKEINTGVLIVKSIDIKLWLSKITNDNLQHEYYITDIIALAYQEGREIAVVHPKHSSEVKGVNNRLQLSNLERIYQSKQAEELLLAGVMLYDPLRFDLRGTLKYGRDIEIDINVVLEGNIVLGNRVKIGAGCVIKDSVIGDDCEIHPYSVIENTQLQNTCSIGPFVHLRPGTYLLDGARIGNFVEIKKSCLGKNSKVGHLSYLGDAEIGDNVNIGAGTITCNYNGINKHKTFIEDNVFIGSDSQLIAPVSIGKGATIAAGTTVTHDVADNELVLSRVPQVHKKNWQYSMKKKK